MHGPRGGSISAIGRAVALSGVDPGLGSPGMAQTPAWPARAHTPTRCIKPPRQHPRSQYTPSALGRCVSTTSPATRYPPPVYVHCAYSQRALPSVALPSRLRGPISVLPPSASSAAVSQAVLPPPLLCSPPRTAPVCANVRSPWRPFGWILGSPPPRGIAPRSRCIANCAHSIIWLATAHCGIRACLDMGGSGLLVALSGTRLEIMPAFGRRVGTGATR